MALWYPPLSLSPPSDPTASESLAPTEVGATVTSQAVTISSPPRASRASTKTVPLAVRST